MTGKRKGLALSSHERPVYVSSEACLVRRFYQVLGYVTRMNEHVRKLMYFDLTFVRSLWRFLAHAITKVLKMAALSVLRRVARASSGAFRLQRVSTKPLIQSLTRVCMRACVCSGACRRAAYGASRQGSSKDPSRWR